VVRGKGQGLVNWSSMPPRGQHWVTVKNDLLIDIYQQVISDISK